MVRFHRMFHVKRNDTQPRLKIVCTSNGNPVALSGAASIRVLGMLNGAALFDHAVTGAGDDGIVAVTLDPSDTEKAGRVQVEVEVTWAAGQVQTFPPDGYLIMKISADLA